MTPRLGTTLLLVGVVLLSSQVVLAQSSDDESKKLAAIAQNPIASVISLPMQYNFNGGYGPTHDDSGSILNIQPVIPFKLGSNWNLITRTIIPLVDLPINSAGDTKSGIGDVSLSLFLSPAKPGKWIWGAGLVASFPTASDDPLGSEKTSMGPALVVLRSTGPWTYGALMQNVWDIAGDDDRADVSSMLFNPFINYNIPNSKGWYITSGPNITANWEASSGNKWTLPLGAGVGKVFKIGKQAINQKFVYYNNVETPDGAADYSIQWQFTLLFPK